MTTLTKMSTVTSTTQDGPPFEEVDPDTLRAVTGGQDNSDAEAAFDRETQDFMQRRQEGETAIRDA